MENTSTFDPVVKMNCFKTFHSGSENMTTEFFLCDFSCGKTVCPRFDTILRVIRNENKINK